MSKTDYQYNEKSDLDKVQSHTETIVSIDRNSTVYSEVSTVCQDKDFLPVTDEDKVAGQLWLQYIPRCHPVTGVPVQTTFAGKKRRKYRGFRVFILCTCIISSATMTIFGLFNYQLQAPRQVISIYYGLLSLASLLFSFCIASIISVSIDKSRGLIPPFIRRLDLIYILSCGQWSVIRTLCTANQSYFSSLVTNITQTLISQIFNMAFIGGDVFQQYVTLIASIASWYSVVPVLIGTSFAATYLFCIIGRTVYFPSDRDAVRRFVLGAQPGSYVVGPTMNSCVHRIRESYNARHRKCDRFGNRKDMENTSANYEQEVPLAGWEAVHSTTDRAVRTKNVQMYVLTNGSTEEVQHAVRWAIRTHENVYLQGRFECGLCACSMAQLLRCSYVIVQHSNSNPPQPSRKDRSQRLYKQHPNIFLPWRWFSHA
ncbi:hypothetical protein K450DRAFT_231809 [Umbelopsis ramanniana AG]|uniref:Uncharacterized protein n=1 Tax=Umbelopsis ramanniana AG TaxID=1314678 RepID=A0AAD5EDS0_UMBRA|nr:uncharacterized protein K450DRAFT_231809 [Umbelopsis ramanniana AG]KAI8581542.1 hypothetical protein K450DRAFT_231809 [Umbelopsis ramanniana AG]